MKKLRTIQADTMAAALAEVKRTLGADAVILHTRAVDRRTVLGIGRRRGVEVIAACANLSLPDAGAAGMLPRVSRKDAAKAVPAEGAAPNMPVVTDEATPTTVRRLRTEIDELRRLVADLPRAPRRTTPAVGRQPSAELAQTRLSLLASEIADDIADEMIARVERELTPQQCQDPATLRRTLARYVAQMVPAGGEIAFSGTGNPTVVALVGTTGVGKTTTVAKLAAECVLRHGRRAGIVSLDTQRAGAVEPLRAYAEIMDVPLRTAGDAFELSAALSELGDCDLVLIDTPGCNPSDPAAIARLRSMLQAAGATIHLVLPASAGRSALLRAIDGFAPLAAGCVLFTKLDEAVGCGVILECLRRTRARLSYVTDGQNIAEDIAVGAGRALAERIVAPPRAVRQEVTRR